MDARLMITLGSLLFFVSMWQLSRISSQAGANDFFWPLILRSLGLGSVFVPLATVTLSGLSPRDLPQATGQSNFFRMLAGSFGIALMATLLTHFTQESRAVLGTHVSWYEPATRQRLGQLTAAFAGRGADAVSARQRALTVMQAQVMQQASVLAFAKLYLLSGFILVAALPLLLLLPKRRQRARSGGPPPAAE